MASLALSPLRLRLHLHCYLVPLIRDCWQRRGPHWTTDIEFTISLSRSDSDTMHIVAHAATPIRGTTPLNRPLTPESRKMCFMVDTIVAFAGLVGSAFIDCISTRKTWSRISMLLTKPTYNLPRMVGSSNSELRLSLTQQFSRPCRASDQVTFL